MHKQKHIIVQNAMCAFHVDTKGIHNSGSLQYNHYHYISYIDISEYVGNVVWVAFRYYDSVGYGESWFVDDVRVWGGNDGDEPVCGVFFHYNVYMDGTQIGTADSTFFTVEGFRE